MTATEIIYAIREKLKAYTDDTRYTDAYLYFLVNLKRSVYLRREYNQLQKTIDSQVLQTICMELEETSKSICPECYSGCEDCTVIRTVKKLPKVLELHSRSTITKIGTTGVFSRPINLITMDRLSYIGDDKHEKNAIFAGLHSNGHIYFKSKSTTYRTLEYVDVTALFENPDDIAEFKCKTSDNGETVNCYDPTETEYPAQAWMVDLLILDIVRELATLKQIPEDTLNNAKDDNS
jgi:hypothetical protein